MCGRNLKLHYVIPHVLRVYKKVRCVGMWRRLCGYLDEGSVGRPKSGLAQGIRLTRPPRTDSKSSIEVSRELIFSFHRKYVSTSRRLGGHGDSLLAERSTVRSPLQATDIL
jgi:hypothetical protein